MTYDVVTYTFFDYLRHSTKMLSFVISRGCFSDVYDEGPKRLLIFTLPEWTSLPESHMSSYLRLPDNHAVQRGVGHAADALMPKVKEGP